MNIETLQLQYGIIKKNLEDVYHILEISNFTKKEELIRLHRKIIIYEKELEIIYSKISTYYSRKISDEIIGLLRNNHEDWKHQYDIYLLKESVRIGYINYRGDTNTTVSDCKYITGIGDIGYRIHKKYRGNGYASRALNLLGKELFKDGITKYTIVIEKNNIPSIHTAMACGATLTFFNESLLLYECNLIDVYSKNKRLSKQVSQNKL